MQAALRGRAAANRLIGNRRDALSKLWENSAYLVPSTRSIPLKTISNASVSSRNMRCAAGRTAR